MDSFAEVKGFQKWSGWGTGKGVPNPAGDRQGEGVGGGGGGWGGGAVNSRPVLKELISIHIFEPYAHYSEMGFAGILHIMLAKQIHSHHFIIFTKTFLANV